MVAIIVWGEIWIVEQTQDKVCLLMRQQWTPMNHTHCRYKSDWPLRGSLMVNAHRKVGVSITPCFTIQAIAIRVYAIPVGITGKG